MYIKYKRHLSITNARKPDISRFLMILRILDGFGYTKSCAHPCPRTKTVYFINKKLSDGPETFGIDKTHELSKYTQSQDDRSTLDR